MSTADRHHHAHPSPPTQRSIRLGIAVLVCAAVLTTVGMVWLWPRGLARDTGGGESVRRIDATVLAVRTAECASGGGTCTTATVRLDAGPDSGRSVDAEVAAGPGAPRVRVGESVVVTYAPDATPRRYEVSDHQRGIQLWILVLAFAAAVVAFGRLRGLTALIGLGVTFAILLLFIVPAILDGRSPLLVAVVGSAAIMLAVLYLTHGFTAATSVAAMGVLISLALTGVLAAVATSATYLTGVASDETVYVSVSYGNVDMRGLLLAGILIGSLGVLDDIAVTQAATVEELAAANPSLTAIQLYRAATRIGRAHIASVVNTIILAYAGAALPLLLLISAGSRPLDQILTNQAIAQEIIRSIVGTLGLIAAVPVTTMLAAALAVRGVLTGRVATGRPSTRATGRARQTRDLGGSHRS